MNPASMIKLIKAKNTFSANHPKFISYIKAVFGTGIPEDSVIEITVTKPGGQPMTTNIKVKQSDLELIEELKQIAK